MKINKSKAFKKQKSKRGGGGKVTLKPVPENFFKSRGIYPSQHMSPSYKLVQSPRMSPSYKLVQSLTRPIPVQPFNRSLSQNPRHSLSISPITFDSEYVHKTDRIYNSFSPKPKSRSSNRNSQSSPNATSRQGSPNATSNDGIIIKRPILSYDKVNQRDLLIYLDTCNSEYKSFEKDYYDNYKTKIYRDKITYFTRINTEYYQYALSYNGFIRFARNLLNTGDNLQQDHDVKAKKKELREMLKNFEDYLNKQILINKANGYNVPDRIYHSELKVILDIAKEIINKINALYGSKLRQSYLNNRNRGISKLKKVPGKLQDVSVAAVQYFYDKLFKNTDPPDRLGWNVNNYKSRTAAKAKAQSKSGLFKK